MPGGDPIRAAAARIAAAGESRPRAARDPVNLPMIRNWTEALAAARPDRPVTRTRTPRRRP